MIAFAFLPAATFAHASVAAANVDRLTSRERAVVEGVLTSLTRRGTVGVSVVIERDGKLVYARGFGFADVARRRPATPSTVYGICSVTKQFFAALVERLVVEKRVRLDASIESILPGFPHGREISLRELMNQTSGLADAGAEVGAMRLAAERNVEPEAMLALIRGKPLHFAPGARFEYSNTNYIAVGMIVAKLTGLTPAQALRAGIAAPFGLSSLRAGAPPGAAPPYFFDEAGVARSLPGGDLTWAGGAGMLFGNALDLVRWDDAFFGGKVVPLAMVREATTPPILPGGEKTPYAFGWVRSPIAGHTMLWHNGEATIGYAAFNAVFPGDGLKIVLQANAPYTVEEPRTAVKLAAAFVPDLARVLKPRSPAIAENPAVTRRARAWFAALLHGGLPAGDLAAPQPQAERNGRAIAAYGTPRAVVFGEAQRNIAGIRYTYHGFYPGVGVDLMFTLDSKGKVSGMTIAPAP